MSTQDQPDVRASDDDTRRREGWWRRHFWRHRPKESEKDRTPFTLLARRYDSQFYGLIIGIGLPLMGWLVSSDFVKLVIAAAWFALSHNFWTLELDEIRGQYKKQGMLDLEDSDYQRRTMNWLFYGFLLAIAIWAVGFLWFLFSWSNLPEAKWWGPWYGLVEAALLAHTLWVWWKAMTRIYPTITIIQQTVASQVRRETMAKAD